MGKKFKLKRLLRLNYKIKRIVRLYNPFVGATGGIRTPDLPVRSRTLYPAKLQLRDNTYYTLKSKNIQQNFEKNVAIIKKVCYIIQVLKKIEAQRSWQRAWFGTMRSQVRSLSPRPYQTVFQENSIEFENSQKYLKVLFSKNFREQHNFFTF